MMTVAQTLNELIIFAKTFDGIATFIMIGAGIFMFFLMIRDKLREKKRDKEYEKEREEFKKRTWYFNGIYHQ